MGCENHDLFCEAIGTFCIVVGISTNAVKSLILSILQCSDTLL